MLMGASGGIGSFYNLIPELFVEVYDLAAKGKWGEARRAQDRINQLIALTIRFPVFPAIKKMLEWSGIDCGHCLGPRRSLTPHEEAELRTALEAASFNPSAFLK
jgi:N-acetylneuraminate lyase